MRQILYLKFKLMVSKNYETINAYTEIEIGEIYSDEIGNSILKKLFETDLFLILKYLFLITNYTFL